VFKLNLYQNPHR